MQQHKGGFQGSLAVARVPKLAVVQRAKGFALRCFIVLFLSIKQPAKLRRSHTYVAFTGCLS